MKKLGNKYHGLKLTIGMIKETVINPNKPEIHLIDGNTISHGRLLIYNSAKELIKDSLIVFFDYKLFSKDSRNTMKEKLKPYLYKCVVMN